MKTMAFHQKIKNKHIAYTHKCISHNNNDNTSIASHAVCMLYIQSYALYQHEI